MSNKPQKAVEVDLQTDCILPLEAVALLLTLLLDPVTSVKIDRICRGKLTAKGLTSSGSANGLPLKSDISLNRLTKNVRR